MRAVRGDHQEGLADDVRDGWTEERVGAQDADSVRRML